MDPNDKMTQKDAFAAVTDEMTVLVEEWDDMDPDDRKLKIEEISASFNEAVKLD
jgi:hypothetical protein